MKRDLSGSCSDRNAPRPAARLGLAAVCCLLSVMLAGCESVQRKFIRKRKDVVRPSPIVQFRDYSQAMTLLDRYRKHYLLFQYWNDELLQSLGSGMSEKAARHGSGEALQELQTLRSLLQEPVAAKLDPLIAERNTIHQRLMSSVYLPSQVGSMRQELERQTRLIYRDFTWRDVQERLGAAPAPPTAPVPDADGH